MKKIIVIISFVISLVLLGCNGPETPPNNVDDRGHDMPYITTYTFTEGSLSNSSAIGSAGKKREYLADGFVQDKDANEQVISFHHNKNNELVREGKLVMEPNVWYRMDIKFINKSGALINYQFIEDEKARSLHQFFFRSFAWENDKADTDINRMIKKQLTGDDNIFNFRYGDKFSDGTIIDPPIGFVGYLRFNKDKAQSEGIKKIVLNSVLVHVMSRNKLTWSKELKELVPYPFDNPGSEIIGVTDIDHRFEVDLNY